jgi:hypothetical protein
MKALDGDDIVDYSSSKYKTEMARRAAHRRKESAFKKGHQWP